MPEPESLDAESKRREGSDIKRINDFESSGAILKAR